MTKLRPTSVAQRSIELAARVLRRLYRGLPEVVKRALWRQVPDVVSSRLQRAMGRPIFAPLDAAPLARITSEPLDHLCDADFLTNDLLPAMGLSTHAAPRLYPAHLHARVGRGVQSLQLPNQFGPYLATITQQGVRSYVEIGVDRGGTFAITVEVLRRFGLRHAVAVDLDPPAIFEQWGAPEVVFARMDSGLPAFADRVDAEAPIDLAFIDGDHSEEAVRRDFEVLRPHARMLAFHDITDHGCPGVGRVWRSIREKHAEKYEFREFTAQYPELPILPRMGIGLAIRR